MRRNTIAWSIAAVVISLFIWLRCTGSGPVAGTITQSGNGIVCGVVVDEGVPIAGARVLLFPVQYDPFSDAPLPDSQIDTTGSSGTFTITASRSNDYNVEVEYASGKSALFCGVNFTTGDTQTVNALSLMPPGCITAILHDTIDADSAYLYIPGTSIFSLLQGDTVILTHVPAGSIPEVRYRPVYAGSADRVVGTNVAVVSGDTTVIADYSLWKNAQRLYLNTTPAGADVVGDVLDFPVLLRLRDNNFDFSGANADGSDIRFVNADGTPLFYEIERWGANAQEAEVWVKVDTVRGNDSTQSIIMYWGNPEAAAQSNSTAVFDTSEGFQGVWHLAEAGNTTVKDATINRYDGTPTGMSATSAVDGNIGGAQAFDGSSSCFTMANTAGSTLNFAEFGPYTLSAWVYVDTIDSAFHTIVSKGNQQYNLGIMASEWGFSVCTSSGGWDESASAATSKAWIHLVGIRNGTLQYLYVNGNCVDSTIVNRYPSFTRDTGYNLVIGSIPDDSIYFFSGIIDEVCISGVERDPAWIKLSYMNQKANDRLVTFR